MDVEQDGRRCRPGAAGAASGKVGKDGSVAGGRSAEGIEGEGDELSVQRRQRGSVSQVKGVADLTCIVPELFGDSMVCRRL